MAKLEELRLADVLDTIAHPPLSPGDIDYGSLAACIKRVTLVSGRKEAPVYEVVKEMDLFQKLLSERRASQ